MVMYTGGNRIFYRTRDPDPETSPSQVTDPDPINLPDQPVGAIKPHNLTDDNLKVTTKINNLSLGSYEPSGSRFIVVN
jgi:hypothetical protein